MLLLTFFPWSKNPPYEKTKLKGAAIGAGIGIAVGTVIPVIGNVVGGIIGGIIGAKLGVKYAKNHLKFVLVYGFVTKTNWSVHTTLYNYNSQFGLSKIITAFCLRGVLKSTMNIKPWLLLP